MCPPLGGLTGVGFTRTRLPAGPDATLEYLVRELTTQVTRQNEHGTLFANSMVDIQRQLRELTDAATRTTEWMRTHEAHKNDIDKSLDSLRERLDALQSASVSSVETKNIVSDWLLP